MDLDDLVARYQEITPWKRMVGLALIALLPAAYSVFDRYSDLDQARDKAIVDKATEDEKLKEALAKHEKLSKLESELTNYEARMKEASKHLPDEIFMDQILLKSELIAEELGISLKSFKPGEETPSETAFRYLSLPIKLDLVGTYGQITSFFDHIVHLETLIHIENYNLTIAANDDQDKKLTETDPEKMEEAKRSQMRIHASCDMVVFRAQTEAEAQAIQAALDSKNRINKAKADAVKAAENGGKPPPPPPPPPPK